MRNDEICQMGRVVVMMAFLTIMYYDEYCLDTIACIKL